MNRNEKLQRAIREYLQTRTRGDAPEIRDFAARHADVEQELLLRLPCVDFEITWREANPKGDNGPPLELVLKDFPELRQSPEALLELVSIEFLHQPSQPSEDKFVRRIPQIEPLIRSFFSIMKGQAPDDWEIWTSTIGQSVAASYSGSPPRQESHEVAASDDPSAGAAPQETPEHEQEQPQTAFTDGETVQITDQIQVVKYLEKGSSKWVFEALQSSTGRPIALKQLQTSSKQQLSQFVSEGRAQGRLDHQNIPPVFVLAPETGDRSFLLEKLVSVPNWSESIHDPAIPLERKLRILLSVSRAAEYAHREHGIVHRDIKPQNVLIGDFGQVFLIDWGLAVRTRPDDTEDSPIRHLRDDERGHGCGTPAYLPPESALGRWDDCSPATDVFLLGGMLYEILSGKAPFEGFTNTAWFRAATHRFDPLPNTAPDELAFITGKAMSRSPNDRFADAGHFADAIEQFLEHLPAEQQTQQAINNLSMITAEIEQAQASHSPMPPLVRRLISAADQFRQARQTWQEAARPSSQLTSDSVAGSGASAIENQFRERGIQKTLEGEISARQGLVRVAAASGDLTLAEAQVEELATLSNADEVQELSQQVTRRKQQRTLTRGLAWTAIVVAIGAVTVSLFLRSERAQLALEKAEAVARAEGEKALRAKAEKEFAEEQARRLKEAIAAKQRELNLETANRNAERQRLVERGEIIGTRELERDRLPEALAWFTDSAIQAKDHPTWPEREPVILRRLSNLISEFPQLETLVPIDQRVVTADYSAKTNRLLTVTGSWPMLSIRQWDVETGIPDRVVIELPNALADDISPINQTSQVGPFAQYSPDGRWIAVATTVAESPGPGIQQSGRGQLSLFDAVSGEQSGDTVYLNGWAHSLNFSNDGHRLGTITQFTNHSDNGERVAMTSGIVSVWALARNDSSETHLVNIGQPIRPGGLLTSASFTDDLSRVATRYLEGPLQIWNTANGENITPDSISASSNSTHGALLSADGKMAVLIGTQSLEFRSATTGELLVPAVKLEGSLAQAQRVGADGFLTVAFAKTALAGAAMTSGRPSQLKFWHFDRASKALTNPCTVNSSAEIRAASFHPESTRRPWLVSGNSDGATRVTTIGTLVEPVTPPLRHSGSVVLSELTPDSRRLVVVTNNSIAIWNLQKDGLGREQGSSVLTAVNVGTRFIGKNMGVDRGQFPEVENVSRKLAVSNNGKLVATIGNLVPSSDTDGNPVYDSAGFPILENQNLDEVSLWNTATADRARPAIQVKGDVQFASFSPSGDFLAISNSLAGIQPNPSGPVVAPAIWWTEIHSNESILHEAPLPGPLGDVLFQEANGELLLGCVVEKTGQGMLQSFSLKTGEILHETAVLSPPVRFQPCQNDRSRILSVDATGRCQFWERTTDGSWQPGSAQFGITVGEAAVSPDAESVVTAEIFGRELSMWNARNLQKPVWTSDWHRRPVSVIRFHPHGKRLLTADRGGEVAVWSLDGEKPELQLHLSQAGPVIGGAWSPDGTVFCTMTSNNGQNQLFDGETGRPVSVSSHHTLSPVVSGEIEFSDDSNSLLVRHSTEPDALRWIPHDIFVRDVSTVGNLKKLVHASNQVTGLSVQNSRTTRSVSDSLDFLRAESELHPENWSLRFQVARILATQGEFQLALEELGGVIQSQEPQPDPVVLNFRADILDQLRRVGEAANDRLRAVSSSNTSANDLMRVATLLVLTDPLEALEVCKRVESMSFADHSALDRGFKSGIHFIHAGAEVQLEDFDEALHQLQLHRDHPEFKHTVQFIPYYGTVLGKFAAEIELARGNTEGYRAECGRLVSDPDLGKIPARILWTARACRALPDSVSAQDFKRLAELTGAVLQVQPDDAAAHLLHGQMQYRAGAFEDAAKNLRNAVARINALPPSDQSIKSFRAAVSIWLAMALHQNGETRQAASLMTDAIDALKIEITQEANNQAPFGVGVRKQFLTDFLLRECSSTLGSDVSVSWPDRQGRYAATSSPDQ